MSLLFLFFGVSSFAQIENSISGSVSLAETSVADRKNWTAFHNPAALGNLTATEFGAVFENRFFIKELSTKIAQAAIHTDKVNIGLAFSHFGYAVYHDILVGVGLARNFNKQFSIGVQFDYFTSFFVEDSRYRGALVGQIGVNLNVSDKLAIGFGAFNPFLAEIKTDIYHKKIPSVYNIGTSYNFSENLVWRTQIDKDITANYRFATAFEYDFLEKFRLKLGGYGFQYFVTCFGVGFSAKEFSFDLNAEMHPVLGINTLGMLKYKLK